MASLLPPYNHVYIRVCDGAAAPIAHAYAGATSKIDDTKWLSIGAGLKTSFAAVDDQAGVDGDKWNTDFFLNNIPLYLNGQLYKYIKPTFNTECHNCSDGGSVRMLDAIARFVQRLFQCLVRPDPGAGRAYRARRPVLQPILRYLREEPLRAGRLWAANTTFPADDLSNTITGGAAGQFGRDDGIVLWGSLIPNKRLKYAIGAFSGLDDDDINPDREFQYAARLSYNFWNIEDNPGYYTSSTYITAKGATSSPWAPRTSITGTVPVPPRTPVTSGAPKSTC